MKSYFKNKPLQSILIFAFLIRLVAVFISQGFMMFDDHFLVVEIPHAWTRNYDYNFWLPSNHPDAEPAGFSLIYPGFQYLFFLFCDFIGLSDPQNIMFLNRLIHALLSLVTINYSYKIAEKLGNRKTAIQVGVLLSVLAIFPNISVRNLVEMVGIPFIMWGIYLQLKALDSENKERLIFLGAFILGFSFSIRFQNALFLAGVGMYYILKKEWKHAVIFACGGFLSMILFQIQDVLIFGEWFVEFKAYVSYNNEHKNDFLQGGVLKYIAVFIFACGVPLSLAMLFGFFRYPKKYLLLFLPAFLFLAFHSFFPNKQERFILPAVPLMLTTGVMAWNFYLTKSSFWQTNKMLKKTLLGFFWTTNTLLLVLMTTYSTKQARVKAAEYIYSTNEKVDLILVEETDRTVATRIPLFYTGQYPKFVNIKKAKKKNRAISIKAKNAQQQAGFKIKNSPFYTGETFEVGEPNYLFIVGEENIKSRIEDLMKSYPKIELVYTAKPSFVDKIFQKNKRNNNRPIFVFKNNAVPTTYLKK